MAVSTAFRENEHNLHYMPRFVGSGDYQHKQRYKFFEVHFTTQFFLELAQSGSPGLRRFADIIASGNVSCSAGKPAHLLCHAPMHPGCHALRCEGGLKLLYLQSKCIELLTLQAQMYEDAATRSPSRIYIYR